VNSARLHLVIAVAAGILAAVPARQPQAQAMPPAPSLALQRAQVACVRPGGKAGPITITPQGQVRLGSQPLFQGVYGAASLTAEYVLLVRPANADRRLVIGAEQHEGPVEAAIVDGAGVRVVSPGIFGRDRVARRAIQFQAQCDSSGQPYEDLRWSAFGGGRYLVGYVLAREGDGALGVIDLQTGLWAYWQPPASQYPPPRGKFPAGRRAADSMLVEAEIDQTRIQAVDAGAGVITLATTFSFRCNRWNHPPTETSDPCRTMGIPLGRETPKLQKTYTIRLQLGR
jgi:hypothetical protein